MPYDISTLAELLDLDARVLDDDSPALSDGADALTYGELAGMAGRVATALRSLGVEPGDRVAIQLAKSVHSFVAVHGVLRAGAVMVPIDSRAPVEHTVSVLVDADVHVVISDAPVERLARIADRAGLTGVVRRAGPDGSESSGISCVDWEALGGLDPAPLPDRDADDDAYVIYTSGSTGRPKGIVHTHRSALAYVRLAASAYGLRSDDRMANIAGLHFDQSTFELYVAPFVGCAVTVVPDAALRFPASVSELVERERVTVWYSVPFVLRQLVARGALETRDLSSIRWILYGGESYPPPELAELMAAVPSATVSNVYGPAEVNQCMRFDLPGAPTSDSPIPIGRAWEETETALVARDGSEVLGAAGELLVASTTMMSRYLNRPDLTDRAVVTRTFPDRTATRWYRTGDLVEPNADGDLVFVGRVDNQVKVRGQRIELEAIDLTIRELDAVVEVATVVVDTGPTPGVIAVIEVRGGATLTPRQIQRHVASRHPPAAVPVDVVIVDDLPRTASAKVDRNAVLERAQALRRR